MEKQYRTSYPNDVSDEEWAFVAPYLTLCREDAPQREHALRAVFARLRRRLQRAAIHDHRRRPRSLYGSAALTQEVID